MKQVILHIPIPPSVNQTRKVDWRGHKKLKAWREEAGKTLWVMGEHKQAPIRGQFEIIIVMSDKLARADLDNCAKAAIDFVKEHGFIVDDSPRYMRIVCLRFEEGIAPGSCRVMIKPIE